MCGICGKFYRKNIPDKHGDIRLIQNMCLSMHHRGPDEKKATMVPSQKGTMGASRLKIIDLVTGAQPLSSESEDIFVSLNGEIYNYLELRKELVQKGYTFRTNSDTEVLLHLYREKDIEFVHDLIGMFALSIWDEKKGRLLLARDRLGKKPLVYAHDEEKIVFASEIQTLLLDQDISRVFSEPAVSLYFSYNFIPAPHTIFKSVKKLPSSHMLIWENGNASLKKYWDLDPSLSCPDSMEEAQEKLTHLIEDATRIRLRSDRKVGVFLSGGLDSSTVSYFAKKASREKLNCFSIGFKDETFNELPYAEKLARSLELDHTKVIIQEDVLDTLNEIVAHLGEPFADSSLIPTYILCQQAKAFATVCLSGDGGDEAFGGYSKYITLGAKPVIRDFMKPLKNFLQFAGSGFYERYFLNQFRFNLRQLAEGGRSRYLNGISFFNTLEKKFLFTRDFLGELTRDTNDPLAENFPLASDSPLLKNAITMELFTTLPDSLLAKVDIASMSHSLEVRAPLCDHRIVEYAFSLPMEFKLNAKGETKIILKSLMKDFLPADIIERRKAGFSIPLNQWLTLRLRPLFEDAFHDRELAALNIFNMPYLGHLYQLHLHGKIQRGRSLFAFLMFYLWFQKLKRPPHP